MWKMSCFYELWKIILICELNSSTTGEIVCRNKVIWVETFQQHQLSTLYWIFSMICNSNRLDKITHRLSTLKATYDNRWTWLLFYYTATFWLNNYIKYTLFTYQQYVSLEATISVVLKTDSICDTESVIIVIRFAPQIWCADDRLRNKCMLRCLINDFYFIL